jgi:hypothetical protein
MHKIEFVMIVEHKASTLHFFFFFLPRGRTVLLIILDQFFFCLSKKKNEMKWIHIPFFSSLAV